MTKMYPTFSIVYPVTPAMIMTSTAWPTELPMSYPHHRKRKGLS